MKVLFLDMDGCMNTPATWGAWTRLGRAESLEPQLVSRMHQFVREHDLKVVLSSTWRISSSAGYVRTVLCLEQRGWPDARRDFVGATPFLGLPRGDEIAAWLCDNQAAAYVVVDDDHEAGIGHDGRFVHVHYERGVTEADLVKAARIVNGGC